MVCAFVNMVGFDTRVGLVFGCANIWNTLSVSNMVGLIKHGRLIFEGGGGL